MNDYTYHTDGRVFEEGGRDSSGLGTHYPPIIDTLSCRCQQFYKHWYGLIVDEYTYVQQNEGEDKIWRKTLEHRLVNRVWQKIHFL